MVWWWLEPVCWKTRYPTVFFTYCRGLNRRRRPECKNTYVDLSGCSLSRKTRSGVNRGRNPLTILKTEGRSRSDQVGRRHDRDRDWGFLTPTETVYDNCYRLSFRGCCTTSYGDPLPRTWPTSVSNSVSLWRCLRFRQHTAHYSSHSLTLFLVLPLFCFYFLWRTETN